MLQYIQLVMYSLMVIETVIDIVNGNYFKISKLTETEITLQERNYN